MKTSHIPAFMLQHKDAFTALKAISSIMDKEVERAGSADHLADALAAVANHLDYMIDTDKQLLDIEKDLIRGKFAVIRPDLVVLPSENDPAELN